MFTILEYFLLVSIMTLTRELSIFCLFPLLASISSFPLKNLLQHFLYTHAVLVNSLSFSGLKTSHLHPISRMFLLVVLDGTDSPSALSSLNPHPAVLLSLLLRSLKSRNLEPSMTCFLPSSSSFENHLFSINLDKIGYTMSWGGSSSVQSSQQPLMLCVRFMWILELFLWDVFHHYLFVNVFCPLESL